MSTMSSLPPSTFFLMTPMSTGIIVASSKSSELIRFNQNASPPPLSPAPLLCTSYLSHNKLLSSIVIETVTALSESEDENFRGRFRSVSLRSIQWPLPYTSSRCLLTVVLDIPTETLICTWKWHMQGGLFFMQGRTLLHVSCQSKFRACIYIIWRSSMSKRSLRMQTLELARSVSRFNDLDGLSIIHPSSKNLYDAHLISF